MTTRIITGVGLLALLFIALYFGGWVFSLLWVACVCIGMYEESCPAPSGIGRWPGLCWLALIIAIPSFLLLTETTGLTLLMILVMLTMMLVSVLVIFRDEPRLEDPLMSLLPLFSIVLPGLFMLALSRNPHC